MTIREQVSLLGYNTFHIDVAARYFAAVQSAEELQEVVNWNTDTHLPVLVLGGGSNMLFTGDFPGLVVRNEIMGIQVVEENEDSVYVQVGAGENWHRFVLYCVERGYGGVENLSLIPGSTGASPIQNIGAYGAEIKDVFHRLEAFHLEDREVVSFTLQDCAFGYRDSVFKGKYKGRFVILQVTFRLSKKPVLNIRYGALQQELENGGEGPLTIRSVSDAVIRIRQSKLPDPAVIGNAGSFFKNPEIPLSLYEQLVLQYPSMPGFPASNGVVKVAAGWLIEQCGWKGYRKGDAGCYPKQALVLVNYGKAGGDEIWELSGEIMDSVARRFGIALEREVNVITRPL